MIHSKVLFALLLAEFACFVWPTPWEIIRPPSAPDPQPRIWLIYQITGTVEVLDGGWRFGRDSY